MPFDVSTLISNIPTAEDGHIITPDYHNSLRAAVYAIADQLGSGSGASEIIQTYSPVFHPTSDAGVVSAEWLPDLGMVHKPTGGNTARGWLPLSLPDGARLRSLTVTGLRTGSVAACQVNIQRIALADPTDSPTALIRVSLKDLSGQFSATGEFLPSVNADFQIVNNRACVYILFATLTGPAADAVVDLYAFQVRCTR